MGLWNSIKGNSLPRRVFQGLVVAITLGGVGAIVYDVLTGSSGHREASYIPQMADTVIFCASISDERYEEALEAAQRIVENTTCEVPELQRGDCSSPPRSFEYQVRDCGDLIPTSYGSQTLYNEGCPDGHFDTVEQHPDLPGTGVAYWKAGRFAQDLPRTIDHILLHIIGVGVKYADGSDGHTTRASSVMAPIAGTEYVGFDCGPG